MSRQRPALPDVARQLVEFDPDTLERIVGRRLHREVVETLPGLARDEDPADIFVDSHAWLREHAHPWDRLGQVCAVLADRWGEAPAVRTRPEPLGDLHYLCARIGAVGALNGIARVVRRDDLRGVLLPGGEDVHLRALRCLSGLLVRTDATEQKRFLPLFEQALEVPQHVAIALTTLVAFRPSERDRYVGIAVARAPLHTKEILPHLDRNVDLLRRGSDEVVPA